MNTTERAAPAWIKPALTALLIAALALAAALTWQVRRAERAEERLGLDSGRVLSAIFTQAQDLRVATLRGEALFRSENDGVVFDSEQETKAPYQASYFVKLGAIRRSAYSWDAERQVMTVRIPDVVVEQTSIDMGKAQVKQKGVWISRDAGVKLQRGASDGLATVSNAAANSPDNIEKARASALAAVRRMVVQPLEAAGFSGVEVNVTGDWEGGRDPSRLDRSRSIEEVIGAR